MVKYKRNKREGYKWDNHKIIATEITLTLALSFLADKAKRENMLQFSGWWTEFLLVLRVEQRLS